MSAATVLLRGGNYLFPSLQLSVGGGCSSFPKMHQHTHTFQSPQGPPLPTRLGPSSLVFKALDAFLHISLHETFTLFLPVLLFPQRHLAHPHSHCQPCCMHTHPCTFTLPRSPLIGLFLLLSQYPDLKILYRIQVCLCATTFGKSLS